MATTASVQTQTQRRFLTCISAPEAQTIGNQRITLRENHDWKTEAEGKAKDYHSFGSAVMRTLGTANGIFRFTQLMERMPKFANALSEELGYARSPALDALTKDSRTGWVWCATFPRVIEMTPGTISSVKEARATIKDDSLAPDQKKHKLEKAFNDITDAGAMYMHSAGMIAGLFPAYQKASAVFHNTAEGCTVMHDAASLHMDAQNYLKARAVDLTYATPQIKKTVEETKTLNLISTVKNVFSLASGILALTLLATGVSYASALTLATISLSSTVFAVGRKLYEETMMFKPITFLDNKHVTHVTV